MVRYGRIVKTYANARGYPVADVCDDVSGTVLKGCAFLLPGGGSPGNSAYFPPTGGKSEDLPQYADRTRVAYAPVGNGRRSAIILGVLMNPQAAKRFAETPNDSVDPGDTHPDTLGFQDAFVENGGAYFLVSDEGNIVLSAADGQPVRVQLSTDSSSTLRISKGEDASEALLLANRTIAYLTTQIDRLNAVIAEVEQIGFRMTTLKQGVAAAVTGGAPPVVTPMLLNTWTAAWPSLPKFLTQLDVPTDDLVASAVALADESIADSAAGGE